VLGEVARVFYIGQNNMINIVHHLVKPPSPSWYNAPNLKGDASKAGSGLACVVLPDDSYQVNYISADDGSIQQNSFYLNSIRGATWLVSQLPIDNSQLACVQTGRQVYYIGSNGDIRQCTILSDLVCLQDFLQTKEARSLPLSSITVPFWCIILTSRTV
jgi:hypothetical protein